MLMHTTSIGGRQQTRSRLRSKQGMKSGERTKEIQTESSRIPNRRIPRSHTSSSKERKANEKQRGLTEKYQEKNATAT